MARNRSTAAGGEAVIGRGARIRGRVGGDGDLVVEGRVDGDVSVSGSLVVEPEGAIVGEVSAASVTVAGGLTGDVTCRGAIVIRAGAQVAGNMGGSEVALEEGAAFTGRVDAEFELPPELTAPDVLGPARGAPGRAARRR
jgi:cytoskeletal protein CcmA (bactofilin family)